MSSLFLFRQSPRGLLLWLRSHWDIKVKFWTRNLPRGFSMRAPPWACANETHVRNPKINNSKTQKWEVGHQAATNWSETTKRLMWPTGWLLTEDADGRSEVNSGAEPRVHEYEEVNSWTRILLAGNYARQAIETILNKCWRWKTRWLKNRWAWVKNKMQP